MSFSAIKPSLSGERIVATYRSSRSPAPLRSTPAGEPVGIESEELAGRLQPALIQLIEPLGQPKFMSEPSI